MKPTPQEYVKKAFPESEWEWWYVFNPDGTTSYMVVVYTPSRIILGQAMNHSLTVAQNKAYRKASKHPHVTGWHARNTAEEA